MHDSVPYVWSYSLHDVVELHVHVCDSVSDDPISVSQLLAQHNTRHWTSESYFAW